MSQVMSKHLMSSSEGPAKRKERVVTVTLWTVQILLALVFLFAGGMKLILTIEMMMAQMPLPGLFLRFIGACEVAGALGLILPGLTRIQRCLTPLAACGLVVIMLGAVVLTLANQDPAWAVVPLVVGTLAACVTYGRLSWAAFLF